MPTQKKQTPKTTQRARTPKARVQQPAPKSGGCFQRFVFGLVGLAVVAVLVYLLFLRDVYVSPYNWKNLSWDEKNMPTYAEKGQVASRLGCDVSAYDGAFDWQAASRNGLDFTFIRLGWRGYTEGRLNVDGCFYQNLANAKAAGFDVGVYFFSSAITEEEAREEADFVLAELAIANVQPDLPIAFDLEPVPDAAGRANNLSPEQATAVANAFCRRIEAAGHQTAIYGNQHDLARFDNSATSNRIVWLAEYEVEYPTAQRDFTIWQYTENGHIPGIERGVDLDIWFTIQQ